MDDFSEAVIVGNELLLGTVLDTNGADIARRLAPLGCPLRYKTVVGDSDADMERVISQATARAPLVLIAGGLGPTADDRTRFAVARVVGVDLEFRPDLLGDIQAAFRRLGRSMPESNRVQALLPRGAEPIHNPVGTAPGFAVEVGRSYLIALPGVPRELRHLLDHWVVPNLRQRLNTPALVTRTIRLSGVGESQAAEAVADLMKPESNPYLGTLSSPGEVRLVLTARATDETAARALLKEPERVIRARLGKYVFGFDDESHATIALRAAASVGWTVASMEGFSAGALAGQLWAASDDTYRGGLVLPGRSLARRTRGAAGPREAILAAARHATEVCGADVGLAVAQESEVHAPSPKVDVWVGVWTSTTQRARSLPLLFGAEATRLRSCHQVFYELRRAAERAP